ncbi:hypothetical protein M3Y97_00498800 [Aphelenchoides bicaudatus]|nr:hypothetical protein M3Y97_00498800 [Aphelenchoides bicaudatus]
MKNLIWLLLALITLSARVSWAETEDSECIEWAYEPVVEFHGPTFEEGKIELLEPSTQKPVPDEYFAPLFDEGRVELLKPSTQKPVLEEFHGPKFEEGQVELLEPNTQKPVLEEFHGPRFDEGRVELLEKMKATQLPQMPDEYFAPSFDERQIELLDPSTTTQKPVLEEFHGPKFEELYKPTYEELRKPKFGEHHEPMFEEFHGPKYVKGNVDYPREQVHDEFAGDRSTKAFVESVIVPQYSTEVHDEFGAVTGKPKVERPRKEHSGYERKPHKAEPVKKYYPKRQRYPVDDDFVNKRPVKTIVESADVHDRTAKVQDQFFARPKSNEDKPKIVKSKAVKSKPVDYPKREQSTFERVFAAPLYESGPVTQFFLDLVGAKAPVHDNFVAGVSEKVEIEPIEVVPERKAEVHDQFTFSNDGKNVYRPKRSADMPSGSSDKGLWKLVCVKRRSIVKSKVLTAGDFLDAQVELNERITRCIGRYEGDNVAAGLCRKHYLRCTAPTISIFMCSHPNEVFSEAAKQCVPKAGLGECDIKRTLRSRVINFSPGKNVNETQAPVEEGNDVFKGDATDFCLNRPDGFYADSKNCSRVLQCFDKELFEYPPCAEGLGFDVQRGVCDYRKKVPGCTN